MPEIFVNELSIQDFGPYCGEHVLRLTALEGNSGVLIGGKTGAGKTHLLRALYLAVVGESGVGDLKKVESGSDATQFAFDRSLNRRAGKEGRDTSRLSIELSLTDANSGTSRTIKIVREMRHRPSSPPVWNSFVTNPETGQKVTDEQVIQRMRDGFLPRHLARFFFFDAERSQSVDLGHSDIVEGISRILGLWTYGELENDLRGLISSKIPKVYNNPGATDAASRLAEISGKIVTGEGLLRAKESELQSLGLELHEIDAELMEVEDYLATLGIADPQEIDQSRARRDDIAAAKVKIEAQVTDAWEFAMPVALLGDFRRELAAHLVREDKRREWENSRATVEPKIPQVKSDVFDGVADDYTLKEDYQSYYSARLERALHRLFHPPPDGMSDSVFVVNRGEASVQVRLRLNAHTDSIRDLDEQCQKLERFESEVRELDQRLRLLTGDKEALARGKDLQSKRGELAYRRNLAINKQNDVKADITRFGADLAAMKREETVCQEAADKTAKGQSIAALAGKYREAAAEIKGRAADDLRRRMSDYVGELWVEISERSREFAAMEFDSHWKCFLIRRDGSRIAWEDCNTSAGQRQLRLLSFYEALRRLARVVPPLVVDTPLGRLDKEVKDAVLDKLYLSGHQSVILATNSEIDPDGPAFDRIKHKLGRVYTLHPYGDEGSADYEVRITSDYFGRTL